MLHGVSGTWEKGSVRGHLLQAGWGAEQGYPGIIIDPSAEPVDGLVLTSDQLSRQWPRLDEFEGVEYERVLARVVLATGDIVEAHLYQLRRR